MLSGCIATLAMIVALLFLRFFRRTRDPLFLLFSISFMLQGLGRLLIYYFARVPPGGSIRQPEDLAPFYILRLIAYGLIIFAIIHKNRSGPRSSKKN